MPRMKALRQLSGTYGEVVPGDVFEVDDASAVSLESRGLAERVKAKRKRKPKRAKRKTGK